MLVIHGIWAYGALSLWAEDSDAPATAPPRPGRPSRAPRPHPFAGDADVLADALAELAYPVQDLARKAVEDELTLRLPGTADGPLASPSLVREPGAGHSRPAGRAALAAWRVPALTFEPAAAFDLLEALGEPGAGTSRVVLGGSVLYLAALARQAADLVARGRVLPALCSDPGGYAARWRAVLSGADAQRARDLAAAMPPLCRAADGAAESSTQLLTGALDDLADAAARARLARDPGFALLPARRGRRPARVPVAERWAAALTGAEAQVPVATPEDEAEAADLAVALDDWRATAQLPTGPVRTCFRLVEPGEPGDESWLVEFALQSTDDPSLLLPAADIWSGAAAGGWAAAGIRHPEEDLLAGLGTASRLFPELDEGLRTAAPEGVALDTEGAFRFLKQTGPLLSGAGFGVLLPDWVRKSRLGLKITTRSRSTAGGGGGAAESRFGLGDLVDFRYDLALGDDSLDADELEELARLKVPLIRLRGQWVELDDRHLQAALKFLQRSRTGTMEAAEALRDGLRSIDDDLPVVAVDADGWLGDLLSGQAERRLAPVATPAGFRGELRPYQERGLAWLSFLGDLGLGAILADDMGLGKCVISDNSVFMNGTLMAAGDVWNRYATDAWSDGEGEWATPAEPLTVNALARVNGDGKITTARVARLYRQHISEKVRRVRLDDGSEICITRRHKLLGLDDWTKEFAPGDRICVPSRLEWSGQTVDPDLTVLLAWQIAEGYEGRYLVSITQKNVLVLEALLGRVRRLSDMFGLSIGHPRISQPVGKAAYLTIASADYRAFLAKLGYSWGQRSAGKRIPDLIVAADDDTIRRFLREYFSAEGSVLAGIRSVEISSASEGLMRQLSCMLRRFGIWLRVTAKQKRATNGSGIYRTYYIGLIGGRSLRRFHELVGFSEPVKQAKLARLCETLSNTNVEGVPGSFLLALARRLTKLPMLHYGVPTVYLSGTQELSRNTAHLAVAAMDRDLSGEAAAEYAARPATRWTAATLSAYERLNPIDLGVIRDTLAERADREVFYARITSVEDVDYTGWVYDFEVEEHHNFVAGGMLCHNTVQLLALTASKREALGNDPARAPTLLVCPMSLVGNWEKEAARFTPDLRVHVHHGADRLSGEELASALNAADLVITTYGLAARDQEALSQVRWARVVCDEAQNIKNAATRQARAVRALPAEARIALTGTPVENRLTDLWSVMEFVSPGLLGPAERFRTRYVVPIERNGDDEAAERLRQVTGPFILRRRKTDKTIISDLPDKMEMKTWCNLTPEQASLYQATVSDMMDKIEAADEGIERRGLVLATMAKLKQVCNHPAHLLADGSRLEGRSGKLARLEEICDELIAEGDKALCFTQYAEFGRMLQPYLAARLGCPVSYLHGGTPKKQRDAMVAGFQEATEPSLFILSLKAGGTGLNLTAASHVIHIDRWWNPAVEDQATDRAFRIGQRKDVQVRKFVCVGTLEERIDAMIEEKKALAERIVGTGEGWLTDLSVADLRKVLTLSPEAVSDSV
jgi:SNF2 family DNA or RNA helicase/intein/homing endonuclease